MQNEHRAAWSAVGGVLMTVFAGLAVLAWQAGNGTTASGTPNHVAQPASILFLIGALLSFYMMVAPLLHWAPYRAKPEQPKLVKQPKLEAAETIVIREPRTTQLRFSPQSGHRVLLPVVNRGVPGDFYALVETIRGIGSDGPGSWSIRWHDEAHRESPLETGENKQLAVAEMFGYSPDSDEAFYQFLTPDGAISIMLPDSGGTNKYERLIDLTIKVVNGDSGDLVRKRLWLAFNNDPQVTPWVKLRDATDPDVPKPPRLAKEGQ